MAGPRFDAADATPRCAAESPSARASQASTSRLKSRDRKRQGDRTGVQPRRPRAAGEAARCADGNGGQFKDMKTAVRPGQSMGKTIRIRAAAGAGPHGTRDRAAAQSSMNPVDDEPPSSPTLPARHVASPLPTAASCSACGAATPRELAAAAGRRARPRDDRASIDALQAEGRRCRARCGSRASWCSSASPCWTSKQAPRSPTSPPAMTELAEVDARASPCARRSPTWTRATACRATRAGERIEFWVVGMGKLGGARAERLVATST